MAELLWVQTTSLILSLLTTYAVHSTLLLGIALLLGRWHRAGHPAVHDVLLKTALAGGLLTTALQAGLPLEGILGRWHLHSSSFAGELVPASQAADFEVEATLLTGRQAGAAGNLATEVEAELAVTAVPAPPSVGGLLGSAGWPLAIAGLWLCIVAVLSFRQVWRIRGLRRLLATRRELTCGDLLAELQQLCRLHRGGRHVRLSVCTNVTSPIAIDRHEICVPEHALTRLTPAQQRSMLAHELAHIVRRDPFWLRLGVWLEVVFFFQPLHRLAQRHLQETAEFLCDDWAVQRTGDSLSLAKCLAEVAGWLQDKPQPLPVAAMAERHSPLLRRVHRLLRVSASKRPLLWPLRLALPLLLLAGVTGFAPHFVPAPQLSQEQTYRVRRSADIHTNDDRRFTVQAVWREQLEDRRIACDAKGTFVFSEDDSSIIAMTDGFLQLEEEQAGVLRRIEVTPGEAEVPLYRYFENGRTLPFDDAARRWSRHKLAEFMREMHIRGGTTRGERLLENHGPEQLIREIEQTRNRGVARSYLRVLEKSGRLSAEELLALRKKIEHP